MRSQNGTTGATLDQTTVATHHAAPQAHANTTTEHGELTRAGTGARGLTRTTNLVDGGRIHRAQRRARMVPLAWLDRRTPLAKLDR